MHPFASKRGGPGLLRTPPDDQGGLAGTGPNSGSGNRTGGSAPDNRAETAPARKDFMLAVVALVAR